ncbi:hypothetical protein FGB62_36g19 [Gracilaria domingensis]|nr:hypothetical protein FGB62_36g19 [Gracilaria domingensis]
MLLKEVARRISDGLQHERAGVRGQLACILFDVVFQSAQALALGFVLCEIAALTGDIAVVGQLAAGTGLETAVLRGVGALKAGLAVPGGAGVRIGAVIWRHALTYLLQDVVHIGRPVESRWHCRGGVVDRNASSG